MDKEAEAVAMAVIPPATEFGDLCDEIPETIFSFVPLKSLAKLETVSKSWWQLIARVRLHHPPTTDSGPRRRNLSKIGLLEAPLPPQRRALHRRLLRPEQIPLLDRFMQWVNPLRRRGRQKDLELHRTFPERPIQSRGLFLERDGDEFTVLPLPRNPNGSSYSYHNPCHRSLWESEGKLNLCDPDEHGFRIWEFSNNTHESLWKLRRFVVLDDLISEMTRETGVRVTVGNSIRSSGFNEDLQILYIHVVVCKKIVVYSFETKRVVGVWSYGDVGEDFQLRTSIGNNYYKKGIVEGFF
ncbi:unnamed protein product [Cuscuta campestris]|uniref:F-box domain-containing protein n=1 Tax=Cuscuta campestris TaxID=132261 RepID=A0A484MYY9_9ASTE|nr:unnamed protein product [Cuscuta campestris]